MLASNRVECCPERFQMQAATAKRQALILELDMQGLTRSKIALSVGVGQATVYRVLASSKKS